MGGGEVTYPQLGAGNLTASTLASAAMFSVPPPRPLGSALLATGLLVSAALAGCNTTATEAEPASWAEAFDTSMAGALSSVWGSGPSDVWVVGGVGEGGTEPGAEIYHYDGDAWTEVQAPDVGLLVWVFGWGPGAAMAVGLDGGVAGWDGSTWTAMDSGVDADLWGVWGRTPDDVWIVGGDLDGPEPTLLHFDGTSFTPSTLAPEDNERGARSLFKVWGIGDTIFAVGEHGIVVRLVGEAWKAVGAGPKADDDFVSLWGDSEDRIVAVGGRSNARISTWDGAAWTTVAPGGFPGMNAIFMGQSGTTVIGGVTGFVGTVDPSTGAITSEEGLDTVDVHAIWGDGEGRYYAVGGLFAAPWDRGIAWVRTGGE